AGASAPAPSAVAGDFAAGLGIGSLSIRWRRERYRRRSAAVLTSLQGNSILDRTVRFVTIRSRAWRHHRAGDIVMSVVIPFLVLLLAGAFAAYHRMRLATWVAFTATALVACWFLGADRTATIVAGALLALVAVPLLLPFVRKPLITAPALGFLRKALPPLSQTERIALETGSVGFEGELFTGDPDWNKLLAYPKPQLTDEEQAFLDGPVEELCRMTNEWEINHVHADLPPELWDFI